MFERIIPKKYFEEKSAHTPVTMKLIFEKFILIQRLKQSIVMPVTVVLAQCDFCTVL